LAIEGFAGVTATDTSVAAVTVSVAALLLTPPIAAVILVMPTVNVVAKPALPIDATPVTDELHVAVLVRFVVLESVYVPVAVNWSVKPLAIEGLAGTTAIDTSVAAVTVSAAALLVREPNVAVIFVAPTVSAAAKPEPLMLATAGAEELHVAALVKSVVLESV
jgi:hypothetical protein